MARKIRLDEAFQKSISRQDAFSQAAVKNFWQFLVEAQLVSDRRIVDPEPFFWLHPLYNLDRDRLLGVRTKSGVWLVKPQFPNGLLFRKASQMGASVWSIALILWLCIDWDRPLGIACYWPTEKDLQDFIQTRLDPMIKASPKMQSYMEDSSVDSTRAKQIGGSTVYFRYVAGKASADSIPVDILLCDEVRLWNSPSDTIQRLKERLRQSEVGLVAYFSTVGSQGDFMEQQWAQSNQVKYFSHCVNGCHTEIASDQANPNRMFRGDDLESADPDLLLIEGVVLSDYLPDQIVREFRDEDGDPVGCYVCPCCGADIVPKNGGYVETRPKADGMYALEFAATLASGLTPKLAPLNILREFKGATDMKQFMNGYMAKPWLDPEGRPIKPEDWQRARDPELNWAEGDEGGTNYLGADFRSKEMHYIITEAPSGEVSEDGRTVPGRILRVGVYQGLHWKPFLEGLLANFHIRRAVIDYMPFTTDTLELADRYEGRVYLSQYRPGPMVKTAQQDGKGARKINSDGREKHMVYLDQVKSLNYSLQSFARQNWRVPALPLYQSDYRDRGKTLHPMFDVAEGMEGAKREGFMHHLMCLSLVTKAPETTNNAREKVHESGAMTQEFVDAGGFDPHWAHAFNYSVMAALLDGGGAALIGTKTSELAKRAHPAGWTGPGVPEGGRIAGQQDLPPMPFGRRKAEWKCKHCRFGPLEGRATCGALGWEVGAEEPSCKETYRGVFKARAGSSTGGPRA